MKHLKQIILLVFFGLLMITNAHAQELKKYYFTGLARVEINNNAANGNAYAGDTVSSNRTSAGFTVFDLGVHLQPIENFKITSILRLQNQYGVFFGQGSAMALRQLKFEGLIADKIKYELGDIDLGMTPFTLHNYQDTSFFESSLFSLRRKISNYENLNETSLWRVQGAKAKSVLFWGDSSSVRTDLNVFGARTRESDNTLPNRFLTGGSISNIYKLQTLGINYIRFFEQKDNATQVDAYSNDVVSANLNLLKDEENYALYWNTEAGISAFNKVVSDTVKRKVNDGFVLTGISAKLKKSGIKAGVKYRYVGANFYSAAAQSLRTTTASSTLFPTQAQGTMARSPLLFDRYSAPNIYNAALSPSLMSYLPQYGNVLPYGDATPNRTGISGNISFKSKRDVLRVEAETHFLAETSGLYYRQFTQHKAGALLRLDSLLGLEKTLELSSSIRHEKTVSESFIPIDFQTNLFDLGTRLEFARNCHLLLAVKMISIKGNEMAYLQNDLNNANNVSSIKMNETQQWLAWGLQYDFSTKSFFTFHGNYMMNQNELLTSSNYNINQYYLNYTLRF